MVGTFQLRRIPYFYYSYAGSNLRFSELLILSMKNVLFLTSGLYYDPDRITTQAQFHALSDRFRGHVLGAVYNPSHRHVQLSSFEVHGLFVPKFAHGYGTFAGLFRLVMYCFFVLYRALYIHFIRGDKLDAVIACDAFKTGLLALVIRKLTGAKVGLDIVGNYAKAFEVNSPNPTGLERIKQKFTLWITPRIINSADGVKLLYEEQLESYRGLRSNLKLDCFHDIVPLGKFHAAQSSPPYILIAGHPWFLKGVDLLLEAFGKLEKQHSEWRLKIVGYCTDPDPFIAIARPFASKVDFFPNGVPYEQMVALMCNCSIFVLASRTEAMGRVLLEAMAAEKPVVAANVDGIPRIVDNGKTGLLFETGSADDLYLKLNHLMSNLHLASDMGAQGAQRAHTFFSERRYAERFCNFIDLICSDDTFDKETRTHNNK